MIKTILVALVAGTASGLMFASVAAGVMLALLLFYLAPLPLMVAALGWGVSTALIGAVATALALGLMFGLGAMAAFVVSVAVPAVWLGHIALLARPASTTSASLTSPAPSQTFDWYPPGRLLIWLAIFSALITVAALFTLGSDEAEISDVLRRGVTRMLAAFPQLAPRTDLFVTIGPAAATTIIMIALTCNLWLAGKITKMSGRLIRPFPELRTTALPPMTLVVLCVALAFCFSGGLLAMLSQVIGASLLMGYALTGLAVLHTITQGFSGRGFLLGTTYAAIFLMVIWPLIGMAVLGVLDALFGLRERFISRAKPPATS